MQSILQFGPLDLDRFQRLLDLIGKDRTDAFLQQLAVDLTGAADMVDRGARPDVAPPDWQALRDASHVLISLAGSVGAGALLDLSRQLNVAGHAQDAADLPRLRRGMMQEVSAIVAMIAGLRDGASRPGGKP
jgi:hypothetical protein